MFNTEQSVWDNFPYKNETLTISNGCVFRYSSCIATFTSSDKAKEMLQKTGCKFEVTA